MKMHGSLPLIKALETLAAVASSSSPHQHLRGGSGDDARCSSRKQKWYPLYTSHLNNHLSEFLLFHLG